MPPPKSPGPARQPRIILASSSPRRRELLREAGYEFTVVPPAAEVECGVCSESGPAGLVAELALRKAAAVWRQLYANAPSEIRNPKPAFVLAADTIAECDGFILGKPRDENDARAMLTQLSGRDHRVLTSVCLFPFFPPLPLGEGRGEGALKPSPPGRGQGEGALRHSKKLLPAELLQFARQLRKSQTDAEQLMWSLLRNRRLSNYKFRRQYPLVPYVLDFFCSDQRLAVELAGGQHNTVEGRRTDRRRTRFIENQGIKVLRFWNHDVLQDTDTVLEAIWDALHRGQGTLTPNPSPKGRGEPDVPLPLGEGRGEGAPLIRVAVTKLHMDQLTNEQLNEYLDSGHWEGKAGAFGYQDRLGWVHIVEGSPSNVVGLPLELLAEMLVETGAKHEE
jgi:predicted house-cleaning NTP pyrophosphatase (Maf/HAM1 superfamily)/very-short-patch-repair endonuclease